MFHLIATPCCTWRWGKRVRLSNGLNAATRKAPGSMLSFSKSIRCWTHCKKSRDFRRWWLKFSLRTMKIANFFAELKRRNVYKVAVAYAVVAWLLIQAASILFPTFEAPGWVMKVFVAVVAAGFPIALILAWAFELTPEGLKRTEFAGEPPTKAPHNRVWIYVVTIGGAISIGLFFLG